MADLESRNIAYNLGLDLSLHVHWDSISIFLATVDLAPGVEGHMAFREDVPHRAADIFDVCASCRVQEVRHGSWNED